jgi:hypothetical protein
MWRGIGKKLSSVHFLGMNGIEVAKDSVDRITAKMSMRMTISSIIQILDS